MFILIVALSALTIAACAAFFSIKGLMVLFAGSAIQVAVMAGSLELGKLVAASFLHRQWKTSSFFLKLYLTVAVAVLMFITSLGIFGFLTNAYQLHKGTADILQTDLLAVENQQVTIKDELASNATRISSLVTLRAEQEARVKAAGNYKAPREQAYKAIEAADVEIREKEARQIALRDELKALEFKKVETTKSMATKTDIGSFKFIADALNTDVDSAVRYFILSLVFVFDPLAIALVLALNQLIEIRAAKKKEQPTSKVVDIVEVSREIKEVESTPVETPVASVTDPSEVESEVQESEEVEGVSKSRKKTFDPVTNTITIK
jgi:hypothetical protein